MEAIGEVWTNRSVGFDFPQSLRLPGCGRIRRGRERNLPTLRWAGENREGGFLGMSANIPA